MSDVQRDVKRPHSHLTGKDRLLSVYSTWPLLGAVAGIVLPGMVSGPLCALSSTWPLLGAVAGAGIVLPGMV